jgi:hypothetical protein
LHISQQISEQFGGKIILKSEFGHGANFTFLIDLEKKHESKDTIKRHLNPNKRNYPKMIVTATFKKIKRSFTQADLILNFNDSLEIVKSSGQKTQKLQVYSSIISLPILGKVVDQESMGDVIIEMES